MVGFVQLNYSSSENEGRVRVCVHLEDALETTNLTLRLQTHSGSAVGKQSSAHYSVYNTYCHIVYHNVMSHLRWPYRDIIIFITLTNV